MFHVGPISGVAVSSVKHIGTAGYDNQVILWSAINNRPIGRGLHDHLANQCQFNPAGTLLVSASSDYSARVWTVPDMKLFSVLKGHIDDVEMATFSPDGKMIATCSRDKTIRIFATDGTPLKILAGHSADVISVVWADGNAVISSSDDGTVRRWSVQSGALLSTIDLAGVETDTIALSKSQTIYAGTDDGDIVVILENRESDRIHAHNAGIKRLLIDNARGLLASMSYDRDLALWEITSTKRLRQIKRTQMPSIVWPRSAAFLGDMSLIAATFGTRFAGYDITSDAWSTDGIEAGKGINSVCLWNDCVYSIGDAGVLMRDGIAHGSVGSLCNFLVACRGRLLTGGQLGKVFDARSGECVYQHRSPLNCGAVFSEDGKDYAVVGAYTGEGLVFEVSDTKVAFVQEIQLADNAVKGVSCSDNMLFSVSATGSAAWFELPSFSKRGFAKNAHKKIANGCAALPGARFASVSRDLLLRIWDNDVPTIIPSPHTHSIKCVCASRSGFQVATGSYDGSIAIFDVRSETWFDIARPTASGISSLAQGSGPDTFLASSYDGFIYTVTPSSMKRLAF